MKKLLLTAVSVIALTACNCNNNGTRGCSENRCVDRQENVCNDRNDCRENCDSVNECRENCEETGRNAGCNTRCEDGDGCETHHVRHHDCSKNC